VSKEDLQSVFEAARWAPSCFNDQPWYYIVATQDQPEEFEKLLSCLVEGNRSWAQNAPVLALGLVRTSFSMNGKPNRWAQHDLGQASANLALEATDRGLYVHQMGGILPDQARELYRIPKGIDVVTGLAIGYLGNPGELPAELTQRDQKPRQRKKLAEFVFGGRWERASNLVTLD
jgi:nitroreductase